MRRILILSVVSLWAFSMGVFAEPIHIHTTWQGDPIYTIVVSWRTTSEMPSVVEYGTGASYEFTATGPSGIIHHVPLEGLLPGTTYHYRCGSEGEWSEDLTFRTAPSDPSEPFTFVALGDSRTNWEIWVDCSEATLMADPDFVIHTGDIVAHGGDQSEWNIWFDEGKDLLSSKVMMPSIGNHEGNDPKYYQQFALPDAEDWYSFDYGNAHFIALTTEKQMTGTQSEWLEGDLESTNATWIFVFYHRPMYSSVRGPNRGVYTAWSDLFDKHHVDFVFNGHDHCYERTYPMFDDWLAGSPENGTIHIVTGGAGAPLYNAAGPGPWTAYFLSYYHFILITIEGNELSLEARFYNQTVFDELHVSKALLPDLRVASIEVTPTYPIPRQSSTIGITFKNVGRKASPKSRASLDIGGETQYFGVPSLDPGSHHLLKAEWNPTSAGMYNITARADCDDEFYEGIGESNNVISVLARVSEPKPDLVLTDLGVSDSIPSLGEAVILWADVKNEGSAPTGAFDLLLSLNGSILESVTHRQGLYPGESWRLEHGIISTRGDWKLVAKLDPEAKIDELYEDNNEVAETFYFRDFYKDGPAYLPQGFEPGETVLVYYNQTEGEIPSESPTCALVWGINDWKKPPQGTVPARTVTWGLFETNMTEVAEGLWIAALPTNEQFKWIDLKFEDRHVLAKFWDTNNGSNWIIPSGEWARETADELIRTIKDAEAVGVEVSEYLAVLEEANLSLQNRRYLEAAQMLIDATDRCRYDECATLLDSATAKFEEALKEGLDIGRVKNLLTAARSQMESGNYFGSKSFSLRSIELIDEARAKVDEGFLVSMLFLALICAFVRGIHKGVGSRDKTFITALAN